MTTPKERNGTIDYVITDGEEYKRKITNFVSDISDGGEFLFDQENNTIIHGKSQKSFSLNEFVDLIEANHLSDCLLLKRILNVPVDIALKILFFLVDKHYEKISVSIDKYHLKQGVKKMSDDEASTEPFFKYFHISKNIILSVLLFTFLLAVLSSLFSEKIPLKFLWQHLFGQFTLSNPILILTSFIVLFSAEKVSIWLNRKINSFLMPEQSIFKETKVNFIEYLHNFQYQNKFDLKINRQSLRKF